jgi:hypothetical protein
VLVEEGPVGFCAAAFDAKDEPGWGCGEHGGGIANWSF